MLIPCWQRLIAYNVGLDSWIRRGVQLAENVGFEWDLCDSETDWRPLKLSHAAAPRKGGRMRFRTLQDSHSHWGMAATHCQGPAVYCQVGMVVGSVHAAPSTQESLGCSDVFEV